ncbi:MAG: Gfo/Idh/MocA family oxidoreductase [Clostridia bacterium]|nr:Gfo/Idh/MocA family oxidoreductase [Clostridia bacterium]
MLKVVLVGFGGIAQIHRFVYWYVAEKLGKPVELVAAFDVNPAKFTEKTTINIPLGEMTEEKPIHFYTDLDEMLDKEKPDFVDVCLPTKFHASMTIDLLNRGYSVICEKPMAFADADCRAMVEAANKNGKKLMIGQCVRFAPEYEYLHELVTSGKYGRVLGSEFYRVSPPPFWSANAWQLNVKESGGCLFELNIHDVDYVRWLFGDPKEISCTLESRAFERDTLKCRLGYDDHTAVVKGGWLKPEEPFRCGFEVRMEKATVRLQDGKVTLAQEGKEEIVVPIESREYIIGEIAYFVDILMGEIENTKNPPEGSAKTIALLHKLLECAFENKTVRLED